MNEAKTRRLESIYQQKRPRKVGPVSELRGLQSADSDGSCRAIRVSTIRACSAGTASCGKRGKCRTIGEVRRGFIEAAVLEQGYQASEVACFLGCHASNVSRALQNRGSKV